MKFSFSTVLVVLVVLGAVLLAALPQPAPAASVAPTLPNGIAAGDVTHDGAVLWTRSTALGDVTFIVAADAAFTNVVTTASAAVVDVDLPVKVGITNLSPGTRYYYRVTDAAATSLSGTFVTPHLTGVHTGFRMGVAGDWRGELSPYPSIANVAARNLDLFVLHGDTIYADVPSPGLIVGGSEKLQAETLAEFRAKHAEVYGTRYDANYWADLRASTAVLATINDHEVTNNFAGGAPASSDGRFVENDATLINDTQLYENGLQAFQEYNPLDDEFYPAGSDPRTSAERKLYRFRTYGSDAAVFVLDTRSFRDPPIDPLTTFTPAALADWLAAANAPGRTLLGAAQLNDLLADLTTAQQAGISWKFILIPEPIQNLGPAGGEDRYEGYAAERTTLLKYIVENNITNVVFVSADVHATYVNQVTYSQPPDLANQLNTGTFEISTGSVGSFSGGNSIVAFGASLGLLAPEQVAFYESQDRAGQDFFVTALIDTALTGLGQGYSPLGLQDSGLVVRWLGGGYVAAHSFGWTEFSVDPHNQRLRVTTYAIDTYERAALEADPDAIKARTPQVISEFEVTPVQPLYLPLVVR